MGDRHHLQSEIQQSLYIFDFLRTDRVDTSPEDVNSDKPYQNIG